MSSIHECQQKERSVQLFIYKHNLSIPGSQSEKLPNILGHPLQFVTDSETPAKSKSNSTVGLSKATRMHIQHVFAKLLIHATTIKTIHKSNDEPRSKATGEQLVSSTFRAIVQFHHQIQPIKYLCEFNAGLLILFFFLFVF